MSAPVLVTAFVNEDEWYPCYSLALPDKDGLNSGRQVRVSKTEADKIRRVFAAFDAAQDRLREIYESTATLP